MKLINELCQEVYETALKSGFHKPRLSMLELLMLHITELAEAVEADRKDYWSKYTEEKFKKLFKVDIPRNKKRDGILEDDLCFIGKYSLIKDSFEDEIAGAVIRLFDICGREGIDLENYIKAAMRYNKLREPKHGKKY